MILDLASCNGVVHIIDFKSGPAPWVDEPDQVIKNKVWFGIIVDLIKPG
jgi:hypothetical protein